MSDNTPQSDAEPPVIMIYPEEFGEFRVGSNIPGIDIATVISCLELAKAGMVAQYYHDVNQRQADAVATKPNLYVPSTKIKGV